MIAAPAASTYAAPICAVPDTPRLCRALGVRRRPLTQEAAWDGLSCTWLLWSHRLNLELQGAIHR